MDNLHGNMHFPCLKTYMKAKKSMFYVFSPFSASFHPPPPIHHNGKGSVECNTSCLSVCLSVCLSLSVCLTVCLSVCLSLLICTKSSKCKPRHRAKCDHEPQCISFTPV